MKRIPMKRICLWSVLLAVGGCGALSAPEPTLRDSTVNRCVSLSQNRLRAWEVREVFDILLAGHRRGLTRDEIAGVVSLSCFAEVQRGTFASYNDCLACSLPMLDDLYR